MFKYYNPNPCHKRVGDCTVRALSKVLEQEWKETYIELAVFGYMFCDMPSSNNVWGAYLKSKGYKRFIIPDDGIENYSVEQFCQDYPEGTYLLALQSHVIAVKDGDFFDTWDSSGEVPIFYWVKRKEDE